MSLFDKAKESYPLITKEINHPATKLSKYLEINGLTSETLTDSKGNNTEVYGLSKDEQGNYDLTEVRDTLANYLPFGADGHPYYAMQQTSGSNLRVVSFVKQMIGLVKTFTRSGGVSQVVADTIDYDKVTSELLKQGLIDFELLKQDKEYLLIAYFKQGPLLTKDQLDDLVQIVVEGDVDEVGKAFDQWTVYKIHHDAKVYEALLAVSDTKHYLLDTNYLLVPIKRMYDRISVLENIIQLNHLAGYEFVF